MLVVYQIIAIAIACSPVILVAGLLGLAIYYRRQFEKEIDTFTRPWFRRWLNRGLVTPIVVWALLNVGRSPFMPPLIQYVAWARAAGHSIRALLTQTGLATLVIVSCWTSLTLGWYMAGLIQRAKNQDDLLIATLFWSPVLLFIGWFFLYVIGWSSLGFAALLWLWPLTHYTLSNSQLARRTPTYSRAIGKIKFGKYSEAEIAIIEELEACETDFDGWMMLAELYANHFHDMAEAEKTIHDLCAEPNLTLSEISRALHRLADWQLKLREDPVAARRSLDEICVRMPGTHLALMARNRLNQLPASTAEFHEQMKARTVPLPALNEDLDESAGPALPSLSRQDAMAAANQFVERLNQNPNDLPAREKLASVFAEQLGQLDLALEQLELLVGMPEHPPGKAAEWLALMAAWQIKAHGEGEAARKILERLIRNFPQSPQAFAAQRRLGLMNVKVRMRVPRPPADQNSS